MTPQEKLNPKEAALCKAEAGARNLKLFTILGIAFLQSSVLHQQGCFPSSGVAPDHPKAGQDGPN